jgi:hypothetical protein
LIAPNFFKILKIILKINNFAVLELLIKWET